jgi:L-gulonate 3-dehydrogenase
MIDNYTIGIIGGGMIGTSWSIIFASAGFGVFIYEENEDTKLTIISRIREKLNNMEKNKILFVNMPIKSIDDPICNLTGKVIHFDPIEECISRITLCSSLENLLICSSYIQECVPEDLELKQKIFCKLESISFNFGLNFIVGSSSSNIPISKMCPFESAHQDENLLNHHQEFVKRCLIVHPINPPELIPLVELVPSIYVDAKVVETVKKIMVISRKKPILVKKEIDGFVVNRMQYALLNEAYRLVRDDIASPEDIDLAITDGLGMRWAFIGPFRTIHMNAPNGVNDYCDRYSSAIERVCKTQDNSIHWDSDVYDRIHKSMEKNKKENIHWRDKQLSSIQIQKSNHFY